jgi:hypothetical protein
MNNILEALNSERVRLISAEKEFLDNISPRI